MRRQTEAQTDPVRVRLRISGRVQGVFFRASAAAEAERLKLAGWVRNRPDGSVELTAEGPRDKIQELIVWCHHGPRGAHVGGVDAEWLPFTGEFQGFHIAR